METPPNATTNRREEATQGARPHAVKLPPDTEPALRLLEQSSGIDPKDVPGLVNEITRGSWPWPNDCGPPDPRKSSWTWGAASAPWCACSRARACRTTGSTGQLKAAKRMVGFLGPENPRAMIFGQNQGPKIEGWEKYVLDPKRWTNLWEEVGQATGTKWRNEMEVESTDKWNNVRFGVYRVL
ncbi:uncharacterized protein PG986_010191 [Apiospora aurea]|uniref:Uncharacterized protein n=1 Tax=Apiospora aurea TaxID=335848 RepID=A0ABR1Q9W2_9PEZI